MYSTFPVVRAEPSQHTRVAVLEASDQVDREVRPTRRKSSQRRVALVATRVAVVVRAETDDARPPHCRWLTSDLLHNGAEPAGILASLWVGYPGEELRHRGAGSARRRALLCHHAATVT